MPPHRLWLNGLDVDPVSQLLRLGDERLSMAGIHLTPPFGLDRDGRVAVGDTVTVGPKFGPAAGPEDDEKNRRPTGHFLEQAGRYVPILRLEDLEMDFTGIMVRLPVERDFIIRRDPRHGDCIHLLGIDSPGLTCSLAIARRVPGLLTGSNGSRSAASGCGTAGRATEFTGRRFNASGRPWPRRRGTGPCIS
ncbi:MAG: FAD-binding oxidoreductase [Acidobacteria bacterium]|nr:FAD-binding oxidoreductase [Acidobacteriota bacterium]